MATFVRFKPPSPPRPSSNPAPEFLPRVLCVEDEDINWEIAQNELGAKFRISRAKHSRSAFEQLAHETFHLILMDIQLSGSDLDGLSICRILRGRYPGEVPDYARSVSAESTPIVFVTAYSTRYSKEELLAAGGEDLVTKPFDFGRLSLVCAKLWARGAVSR